jgi:hypothetical protein
LVTWYPESRQAKTAAFGKDEQLCSAEREENDGLEVSLDLPWFVQDVPPDSKPHTGAYFDETVALQRFEEFANIAVCDFSANAEYVSNLLDNDRRRGLSFKEFQNFRTYEVKGEHVTVFHIEDDSAIF